MSGTLGETALGPPGAEPLYVFVCGCPRSGTTALGRLLNQHPAVALGLERYRYLFGRRLGEFHPSLFAPPRFLDIRAEDGINPNTHLAGKFAPGLQMRVVGDKIPYLYRRFPHVRQAFPKARVLAIFRDPADVARSWQQRADNPADSWPVEAGAAAGLREWKAAVNRVRSNLPRWEGRMTILSYEPFFRVADAPALAVNFARLLAVLGLRMADADLLQAAATIFTPPRPAAPLALPPAIEAEAAALRDYPPYRALLARAL
jgi:hypothetical protein